MQCTLQQANNVGRNISHKHHNPTIPPSVSEQVEGIEQLTNASKRRSLISPHPKPKKLHTHTNVIFSTPPLIPPAHTLAE
jgi:hypothetical protein